MFIAIIGSRLSGKSTVRDYLVAKGFTPVQLRNKDVEISGNINNMDMQLVSSQKTKNAQTAFFDSPDLLLDHVTQHWRSNFVTTDLNSDKLVNHFIRRPFFMLISIDAPILQRYHRSNGLIRTMTLEDFVRDHDRELFGEKSPGSVSAGKLSFLRRTSPHVKLKITNLFDSVTELHHHLDSLDITNTDRLRPRWDAYFMTLADLASQRSNCMKRRVGAILVRENRVVATGYNGTPRGVKNCNDGGCGHCNLNGESVAECLCLHAEENALLEAGRDRVGANATIYCNTCPCLRCTIKIIQSGVKRVVYNLSYKVDEASANLFREAGVDVFRHVPPPEP